MSGWRLYIVFILLSFKMYGQANLVPNPSFEDTLNCTTVIGWYSASLGTPDYYNACSGKVPNNNYGYQYARTGNAYMGIIPYCFGSDVNKEYVAIKLSSALEANKTYCCSFYVNLADTSQWAMGNIGMYISDSVISSVTMTQLIASPQTLNPNSNFIVDKLNWTLIEGKYTAQGGEQYITIGNFNTDLTTDTTYVGPINTFLSPYYYIDDVSIIACDNDLIALNVFTPNNDGVNDFFTINATNIPSLNCKIYNRWGVLVGEIKSANDTWDGRTTSGLECNDGVYYYVLNAKGSDGKVYDEKGFVQLLH